MALRPNPGDLPKRSPAGWMTFLVFGLCRASWFYRGWFFYQGRIRVSVGPASHWRGYCLGWLGNALGRGSVKYGLMIEKMRDANLRRRSDRMQWNGMYGRYRVFARKIKDISFSIIPRTLPAFAPCVKVWGLWSHPSCSNGCFCCHPDHRLGGLDLLGPYQRMAMTRPPWLRASQRLMHNRADEVASNSKSQDRRWGGPICAVTRFD